MAPQAKYRRPKWRNADLSWQQRPLIAISPYSDAAPSTRVRLSEWIKHVGASAEQRNFAGLASNTVSQIIRHAPQVGQAVVRDARLNYQSIGTSAVIISREVSPFSRGGTEERILRSAAHGTYDFDDALFAGCRGFRRLYGRKERTELAVAAADVVIAGNEYLAGWASSRNNDVRVIPTCVEPAHYRQKTKWDIAARPVLVWLGSRSTEPYLWAISRQLRTIHERTGAVLKVISAGVQTPVDCQSFVERVPWNESTVGDHLAASDIALGPLPDNEYARGKCAYKLLQYAAAGLPIVASPVGANAVAIGRFGGWAVQKDDEWVDALVEAIQIKAEVRQERANQGSVGVRRHYSFASWADEWKAAVGL